MQNSHTSATTTRPQAAVPRCSTNGCSPRCWISEQSILSGGKIAWWAQTGCTSSRKARISGFPVKIYGPIAAAQISAECPSKTSVHSNLICRCGSLRPILRKLFVEPLVTQGSLRRHLGLSGALKTLKLDRKSETLADPSTHRFEEDRLIILRGPD